MKKVETGLALSGGIFPRMNQYMSTGTRVMAMIAEPTMEKVLVKASGWNSFPSCPSRRKTGTKERTMIASEKKIARPTCLAEAMTVSSRRAFRSSGGSSERCR